MKVPMVLICLGLCLTASVIESATKPPAAPVTTKAPAAPVTTKAPAAPITTKAPPQSGKSTTRAAHGNTGGNNGGGNGANSMEIGTLYEWICILITSALTFLFF